MGWRGSGGPDALLSAPYEQLVDAGPIDRPDGPLLAGGWLTLVSATSLDRLTPLLDLLNVGFVLARPERVLPGLIDVPMQGTDRLKPLRRPTAWPRAFFTDGVTTYVEPEELLRQVAAHGKPLASVQSTDHQAMEATRGLRAPAGDSIPARGYMLTGNTTSFVVRASGPGARRPDRDVSPRRLPCHIERPACALLSREPRVQGRGASHRPATGP